MIKHFNDYEITQAYANAELLPRVVRDGAPCVPALPPSGRLGHVATFLSCVAIARPSTPPSSRVRALSYLLSRMPGWSSMNSRHCGRRDHIPFASCVGGVLVVRTPTENSAATSRSRPFASYAPSL